MPMRRRVRAGVTAGILAASLSVSGCDAVRHVLDQQAERSPSPSTTQPVTDPAQRVRQSDLETKVGAGMNARTSGGAMIVASNGARIPNGIVEASAKAASSVRALDPQASKNALLVLVPRDNAEFKEYTGQDQASQLANTVTGGGRLPFVVMSDWTVKNPDTLTTRETLAHEAFHALTLEKLATERPLWLLEGWAEYVGQRTVPQAPHKRDDISPHVPSDEELRGANAADAYYTAFTFARYLRDTHGHDKVMAFYSEAVRTKEPLEALLNKHFGKGLTALESGYVAWYPTFR